MELAIPDRARHPAGSSTSGEPLVSVVVNNYNHARYLRETLDALLAQTYQDFEIIAVDAGSTDGSRALLEEYAARDARIRLVFCATHEPYPAVTYNLGFLHARSALIAINDSDDISLPHRLELQVAYLLAHPDVGVCGSNCREFNDSQDLLVETTVELNVQHAAPPARNPTLMFRRDLLASHGLWNWKREFAADFEWLYRFYCGGVKFHVLQDCCLMYRKSHGGNVSVKHGRSQTLKLALFRTYFGIRLGHEVGWPWWVKTLDTYLYLLILTVRSLRPSRST